MKPETYVGTDGVLRVGHRLTRREAEPTVRPQQKPKHEVKPGAMPQAAAKAIQPGSAPTFAQRLRAILDLPAARHRQRQALAIAAETAAPEREAAAILATLPEDKATGFAHGASLFPGSTVQHDEEAQRILAILKSPEAEGREKQALELSVDTALPLEQVLALLGGMPKASARTAIPSIAARAALEAEFGESLDETKPTGRSEAAWSRAVEKANAAVTGAPGRSPLVPPAPPPHTEPAIISRMKS